MIEKPTKRVLVLVQGISHEEYLEVAVRESALDLRDYDHITLATTEKIFDKSLVSKIPFLGDRYGDILQYFRFTDKRKFVCKKLTKLINKLREEYDRVDVLAHSLGTLITLTCEAEIDNLFSFGSPLSFRYSLVGELIRRHTKKFLRSKIKNLVYASSPKDLICSFFDDRVKKALSPFDIEGLCLNSNHDISLYLEDYICKHGNKLFPSLELKDP